MRSGRALLRGIWRRQWPDLWAGLGLLVVVVDLVLVDLAAGRVGVVLVMAEAHVVVAVAEVVEGFVGRIRTSSMGHWRIRDRTVR
jgi:hypothetical protein